MKKHQLAQELQTDEIAEGTDAATQVDAAVTSRATPEQVLRQSGILGHAESPVNSQPRNITTASSGGGEVTFNSAGAKVNAGGTSGDDAHIYGLNHDNSMEYGYWITEILFLAGTSDSYSDDFYLGQYRPSDDNGVGWNISTGEVLASGTVEATTTTPTYGELTYMRMVKDFTKSETRFTWEGGVSATATASSAGRSLNRANMVSAVSNGNNETLTVADLARRVEVTDQ